MLPTRLRVVIPLFCLMSFMGPWILFAEQERFRQVTSSTIKLGENLDKLSLDALSQVPTPLIKGGSSDSIHFILYRNNIFIQVSVNNSKQCLFWVDTGGGTSFINSRHPNFKEAIQTCPKVHVINVEKNGQVVNNAVVLFNCPSMKFGGVELQDTIVEMKESDDFDKTIFNEIGLEVCGMLGTTALRALVSEIDYPQGTIRFILPSAFAVESKKDAKRCSFTVNPNKGNLPYVKAQVNGKDTFDFDFDTGCSGAFRISEDLVKNLGLEFNEKTLLLDSVKIGQLSFEKQLAKKSSHPFCIVGYGIFRNFRITIDYSRGTIYFE